MVHTIGTINPTLFTTGLLVDEWVEVVPSTRETTALAFQFDPPDACAPQSVLLAVPPVPGPGLDRRDPAPGADGNARPREAARRRLRGARRVAQYLPGLYFAFNTEDEAVSTDFAAVTR